MSDLVFLIPIGVGIGILLGSVGGGGSLVAVPALVYVGDQSVRGAQAGALVVVIAASSIGFASYLRRGDVRWRAGLAFGVAAGVSSFAGSLLSKQLDPNVLLLAFSPVMVAGAYAMVKERGRSDSSFRPWREGVSSRSAVRVTLFGLATGWLTGLFGVGGGFVIVPVLVLGLGFGVTEAVGTSLLVIIIGSLVALAERIGSSSIDWGIVAPFAGAAIVGVLLGSALGERASGQTLTRWFAVLVVATAIYTATEALVALL
jgi:uncharacterized membrane protein YfcA